MGGNAWEFDERRIETEREREREREREGGRRWVGEWRGLDRENNHLTRLFTFPRVQIILDKEGNPEKERKIRKGGRERERERGRERERERDVF